MLQEIMMGDNRSVLSPGAKPTIASYNATGSLARFENKNILLYFEKRSSLLQLWLCTIGWLLVVDRWLL
jgi:hypothetical protein